MIWALVPLVIGAAFVFGIWVGIRVVEYLFKNL